MQSSLFKNYAWLGMGLALVLLGMLVLAPLLIVFGTSLYTDQKLDLLAPLQIIRQSELSEVLFNSIWLGLCVIAATTVLAFPLAWVMAKTPLRRHKWLDIVLLIPFMTPPYIGSMGWMLFMQTNGYMEQFIPASSALTPAFFSFGGMVAIMSLHLFPFLYLLLRNALLQIGGSMEEAAAVHGGGFLYRLRRIVLPLLLSSYVMGSLLIFVKTIAEFGTPATFGRKIGFYVMTSEIHKYISSWPIDFGKATSLASVLLAACLVMWYIQSTISSRYSYRLVGGKGAIKQTATMSRWGWALCWMYIGVLLIASIGIPYFSIITASLLKLRGVGLAWDNLTLQHYVDLLTPGSASLEALLNSFGLSIVASTIAVVLGTWFALTVQRSRTPGQKLVDLFSLLPNTVPGIVIVVGLILLWNAKWMPIPLYNTYGMVVLTYVILFLPYTVQYVKASYGQIDPMLLQAGQVFGGRRLYVLRRILLPLLLPGMLAGWMMTFTIANRELVASLLVLPPSMKTSATYIFAQFEQGEVSMGMAMAVITVGITTVLLLAMNVFSSQQKVE
ncbi:iron(III) transport system permease protein [Paenibacillus algorifonticola]|uniref:Iron(III) transport system permease protein n=1 Tax=Paenibacillus algorifonticola TaxID=684063 RepID=A0A1I2GCT1_9BACL|nr:iron ABC transporter permease [Paenibacillus algorifonticola]SFF14919.1 iron(III) transport system permease protein [Paenibacillus algorifonticola]